MSLPQTRLTRAAACVATLLVALAAGGCGLRLHGPATGVTLDVSDDFGARPLLALPAPRVRAGETVLRLLRDNAALMTGAGGSVESIDGRAAAPHASPPLGWAYYVNGAQPSKRAADTTVHSGDRIWWDRHATAASANVTAVVGSFPEPFTHGIGGKRLPVRLICLPAAAGACSTVSQRLTAVSAIPFPSTIAASGEETDSLTVLVGAWSALRTDPAAGNLELGPAVSGVYARFSADGSTLTVLDARGAPTRVLGAGTGLVAATTVAGSAPIWLVTGTDPQGVASAAAALDEQTLHDRFAVAASAQGILPLPVAAAAAP